MLIEYKIFLTLVKRLEHSEDNFFAVFDRFKWSKGVKSIGCGKESKFVTLILHIFYRKGTKLKLF